MYAMYYAFLITLFTTQVRDLFTQLHKTVQRATQTVHMDEAYRKPPQKE